MAIRKSTEQVQTLDKAPSLYEVDYNLWILSTVESLRRKSFSSLDLENLIDEVIGLSRRDKKKLKSLLKHLIEHFLKLQYWKTEQERNQAHWKSEIENFRQLIRDELNDSPSLKPFLKEIYLGCYQDARKLVALRSQLSIDIFPEQPLISFEQSLDENWFPESEI